MRFKACYINKTDPSQEYWRTVTSDSLNQAMKEAERLARKGYQLRNITQVMGDVL